MVAGIEFQHKGPLMLTDCWVTDNPWKLGLSKSLDLVGY